MRIDCHVNHLRVVLGVSSELGEVRQVYSDAEVRRRHNVPASAQVSGALPSTPEKQRRAANLTRLMAIVMISPGACAGTGATSAAAAA